MISHLRQIVTALLSLLAFTLSAQSVPPTVRAYIEQDSVLIGDRFTLAIEVEKDQV